MYQFILSLIVSGFFFTAHAANVPDLDIKLDQNILKNGELQTFVETLESDGAGGKKRVIGVIMIEAMLDEVWSVIQNWDNYGEFVPGLKYYKTIQKKMFREDPAYFQSFIEGYIKLPMPFIRKTYTLDALFNQKKYFIQWSLVKYDRIQSLKKHGLSLTKSSSVLQNIEGFSYLKPFDNETKTILYYSSVVEINIPVPQRVEQFLSGTIMKGFMEAIKNRVETQKKDNHVEEE
jgi:hypothetical protein